MKLVGVISLMGLYRVSRRRKGDYVCFTPSTVVRNIAHSHFPLVKWSLGLLREGRTTQCGNCRNLLLSGFFSENFVKSAGALIKHKSRYCVNLFHGIFQVRENFGFFHIVLNDTV